MEATFINQTPGEIVARFRHSAGLTLHELGEAADVPFSYIWAIEKGKRQVGQKVASRLAKALKMSPAQSKAFLMVVAQEAKRDDTTEEARAIPQALLNAIAAWITPRLEGWDVQSCYASDAGIRLPAEVLTKLQAKGETDYHPDLIIKREDGRWVLFETKVITV
jgi:transcriptional regulator with XRE-family HTH domain